MNVGTYGAITILKQTPRPQSALEDPTTASNILQQARMSEDGQFIIKGSSTNSGATIEDSGTIMDEDSRTLTTAKVAKANERFAAFVQAEEHDLALLKLREKMEGVHWDNSWYEPYMSDASHWEHRLNLPSASAHSLTRVVNRYISLQAFDYQCAKIVTTDVSVFFGALLFLSVIATLSAPKKARMLTIQLGIFCPSPM